MKDKSLAEMCRRQAANLGDSIALVTPEKSWTYADAHVASNRLASALIGMGFRPGDRLGALTKDMAACLILQLAASKMGAVFVPHNWRLAAPELEYVFQSSNTTFLVTDKEFEATLGNVKAPTIRLTLVTDGDTDTRSFFGFMGTGNDVDPGFNPEAGETALQLSSSGTTGLPKSIELTHSNLLLLAEEGPPQIWRGADQIRYLSTLPNFHVAGMGNLVTMFYQGATIVALREFDPTKIVDAISHHQITHIFLVPAMMQFILQSPAVKSADFSSLRGIAYGGSPISETLMKESVRVFGCGLTQIYGMTEATGLVTYLTPEDHDPDGPRSHLMRSAGRPADGVSIRIVNSDGKSLPDGEVGEICVRTRRLMKGYYGNSAATSEVFPEGRDGDGGWYRSGDAGYVIDGYVYIHDRVRDMVISGGENIYPAEIENVLASHPAVADVAVIGVPDERWGESVKACVVRRPGMQVDPDALINYCRERLAHYKCPKSVDFMDSLPRNPTGKLLKRILRAPHWENRGRNVS